MAVSTAFPTALRGIRTTERQIIGVGREIAAEAGVAAPTSIAEAAALRAEFGLTETQIARNVGRRSLFSRVLPFIGGAALIGGVAAAFRRRAPTPLQTGLAPPIPIEEFLAAVPTLSFPGAPVGGIGPVLPTGGFPGMGITTIAGLAGVAPAAISGGVPGITFAGAAPAGDGDFWSRFWGFVGDPARLQALGIGTGATLAGGGALLAGGGFGVRQLLGPAAPTVPVAQPVAAAPAAVPAPAAPVGGIDWNMLYLMQ